MTMLPDDPMAVLAAANDVYLARRAIGGEENSRRPFIYICEEDDCACLFWPDDDGDCVYPDRMAFVTSDCAAGNVDCPCHQFPYCSYDHEAEQYIVTRKAA